MFALKYNNNLALTLRVAFIQLQLLRLCAIFIHLIQYHLISILMQKNQKSS